ncbi:hypothetical protein BH10BAC6_BH10BAC6_03270 [soil metagenome]
MRTKIRKSPMIILTTIGILPVAIVVAFLFEEYYRQFARWIMKCFNGDNIQFVGKISDPFPSNSIIVAFALFTSMTFLLLKFSTHPNRLKRTCLTIIVFVVTTIVIVALDSKRLLFESTAYGSGVRFVRSSEVSYDTYFIISSSTSIAYLLTTYLLERARVRKGDETI